jgi:hypothetical protein
MRYVDVGEEWDEEDFGWRHIDGFENRDIIEKAFRVCGNRKYFKSKKESRKWNMIDGQLSRGAIRKEWVNSCIEWAEDKNSVKFAINVDALASLVLNKARMQDWNLENRDKLRRPEDYF